jgi:hypothetical protein
MASTQIELTRGGSRGLTRVGAIGLTLVGAISLTLVGAIGLSLVGAMAVSPVGAMAGHHSVLPFDGATPTTVEGTVVSLLWQNPHTMIAVDVDSVRWTIESEGATQLRRLGWTEHVIKAGDRITVLGARAKDGRRLMRCKAITLTDGRELPCFS